MPLGEWKGTYIACVLLCLFRAKNPLNQVCSTLRSHISISVISVYQHASRMYKYILSGDLAQVPWILGAEPVQRSRSYADPCLLSSSRDENEKCSLRADVCAYVVQLSLHIVNRH